MNTSNLQPPPRGPGDASAPAPAPLSPIASRAGMRRRRSAPRGRRDIGAHWHRRGEWRSVVTGGVAQPSARTPRRAWMSIGSVAAIAVVAGAAIGIGATRLGVLPASGTMPIVLAALAFAASGVFALIACCVEVDEAIDRDNAFDRDSDAPSGDPDGDRAGRGR